MELDLESIAGWMAAQRWYAGKPNRPRLRLVEVLPLPRAALQAQTVIAVFADEADGTAGERHYQVPLTRRRRRPADDRYVVQRDAEGVLVDAVHDAAFAEAALTACGVDPGPIVDSFLLGVEQSNSSVVVRFARGDAVMIKVFRLAQAGANPDVELMRALAGTAPALVPRVDGHLRASWGDGDERHTGDLLLVEEFAEGTVDGWRSATTDPGFPGAVASLGAATRMMHTRLAQRLGTEPVDEWARAGLATDWEARLRLAIAAVPALEAFAERIRARYAAALDGVIPPLQRVHGDLHLGQVLRTGDAWLFVDFEGEPLRPLADRIRPDLALRDVAGMLRSLDYARAAAVREREWGELARRDFVHGYFGAEVPAEISALLDALVIDKAVYEARYEAGNRPDWLHIPLAAIERLITG